MSELWKNRESVIREYYLTLKNLKNINTSFKFINDNIHGPSINSISARPSIGKSLLVDQIGHEFVKNKFRWLSLQLELTSYDVIKRELIYSNIPANKKEIYFQNVLNEPIDVIENININNLFDTISSYMNYYKGQDILVTIDHLFLVVGCDNGKNLQPIFSALVKLKKMGAYIIVLSHLKRDVYLPERCKQGHVNNQIFENDVYMSDTILQYSDFSVAMDIPMRRGIKIYGPNKIPVNPNDIVISTLKNRNGSRYSYLYHLNDNLTYSYLQRLDDSGMSVSITINDKQQEEDFDDTVF